MCYQEINIGEEILVNYGPLYGWTSSGIHGVVDTETAASGDPWERVAYYDGNLLLRAFDHNWQADLQR